MAPPTDYDPNIAPAAFVAGWRQRFRSKPSQTSSAYTLPKVDCHVEHDTQPDQPQAVLPTDIDVDCEQAVNDWVLGSAKGVTLPDLKDLQHAPPEVWMALAGTIIRQ
jgi:hypothetical protein